MVKWLDSKEWPVVSQIVRYADGESKKRIIKHFHFGAHRIDRIHEFWMDSDKIIIRLVPETNPDEVIAQLDGYGLEFVKFGYNTKRRFVTTTKEELKSEEFFQLLGKLGNNPLIDYAYPNDRIYFASSPADSVEESASDVMPQASPGPWWETHGTTELAGGWRQSDWFGTFRRYENDWVFHADLGWLYVKDDGHGGLWAWQDELGWLWACPGISRYLFKNDSAEWLYYLKNTQDEVLWQNPEGRVSFRYRKTK